MSDLISRETAIREIERNDGNVFIEHNGAEEAIEVWNRRRRKK